MCREDPFPKDILDVFEAELRLATSKTLAALRERERERWRQRAGRPALRFRLGPDGLTVLEHFTRIDDGEAAWVPDFKPVLAFNADVMPESRADILAWLNDGFAAHRALETGRSS